MDKDKEQIDEEKNILAGRLHVKELELKQHEAFSSEITKIKVNTNETVQAVIQNGEDVKKTVNEMATGVQEGVKRIRQFASQADQEMEIAVLKSQHNRDKKRISELQEELVKLQIKDRAHEDDTKQLTVQNLAVENQLKFITKQRDEHREVRSRLETLQGSQPSTASAGQGSAAGPAQVGGDPGPIATRVPPYQGEEGDWLLTVREPSIGRQPAAPQQGGFNPSSLHPYPSTVSFAEGAGSSSQRALRYPSETGTFTNTLRDP